VTTSRQQKSKQELERRRSAILEAPAAPRRRSTAANGRARAGVRGGVPDRAGGRDLSRLNEAERLELRRIEAALQRIDEGRWARVRRLRPGHRGQAAGRPPWAIRSPAAPRPGSGPCGPGPGSRSVVLHHHELVLAELGLAAV